MTTPPFDPDATQPIIPVTDAMLDWYEFGFHNDFSFPVGAPFMPSNSAPPPNTGHAIGTLRIALDFPSPFGRGGQGGEVNRDTLTFRDMPLDSIIRLADTVATFLRVAERHHLHRETWYARLASLGAALNADLRRSRGL